MNIHGPKNSDAVANGSIDYAMLQLSNAAIHFLNMGQSRPLFVLFTLQFKFELKKLIIDVVLGILTQGCRMVGSDGSTKLWQPPNSFC